LLRCHYNLSAGPGAVIALSDTHARWGVIMKPGSNARASVVAGGSKGIGRASSLCGIALDLDGGHNNARCRAFQR